MTNKTITLYILTMIMGIVLIFSLFRLKKKYILLEESVAISESYYLKKKGVDRSCLTGEELEYHLRSFDGGEIWYACELSDDSKIKIIGKANQIYPGLVDCLIKKEVEIDSLLSISK